MKELNRFLPGVLALLASLVSGQGQTLAHVQGALLYDTTNQFQRGANWQSQSGVPLSSTAGAPAGSDGRLPAGQPSASAGQFQGVVAWGAVAVAANPSALNPAASFAANADAIDYPRAKSAGAVQLILRAQAGGSWFAQDSAILFGAEIPVPSTDLSGVNFASNDEAANYWAAEPFTTNGHAGAAYYYSPNARKVYAIQTGGLDIVWRRNAPLTNAVDNPPADYAGNENVKYALIGGLYYPLLPQQMVVSEGTVKLTRKMYWTEGSYASTGVRVSVPSSTIKDIKFAFNHTFPQYVPSNEVVIASGSSSLFGTNGGLLDTRTFWTDNGLLYANNKEGRLFVELLGNASTNGARQQLGYELVDVSREPSPVDVTVELGERCSAYPNNSPSAAGLRPAPVLNPTGPNYVYQHYLGTDGDSEVFATRVTPDLNSCAFHWLEQSIGGMWWPARYVRYKEIWPNDSAKYSHYVRPAVSDETSAQATAIEVPLDNQPVIAYEDPTDRVRSKMTGDFKFYTYLDASYPALRTLIRYNSGSQVAFERVFSWLDANLRTTNFAGTVATELSAWNASRGTLDFANPAQGPRVVNDLAWVGQRLSAPAGEVLTNDQVAYLAGFVRTNQGTGFSTNAYVDPFANGFEAAAAGSIIPINASNNNAALEVWWYRPNQPDTLHGFLKTYWPSTIAHYTVKWPGADQGVRQIILANNAGSGALTSLEAKGALYIQNDPTQPGYNPNEEHALMQGGQVWALRDDLNITNGPGYSSHPYVLLEYADADGRPSMSVFQVLREQGNAVFDYTVNAGTLLQAPMPLPLLDRPLGAKLVGSPARSLNAEIQQETVAGATVTEAHGFSQVSLNTGRRHFFNVGDVLSLQTAQGALSNSWLYCTDAAGTAAQLSGVLSATQPLPLNVWTASAQPADLTHFRFKVSSLNGVVLGRPVVVARADLQTNWLATLAATNTVNGDTMVEIQFAANAPAEVQNNALLVLPQSGLAGGAFISWRLAYEPLPAAIADPQIQARYASFTYQDRKGDTWVYRGPHQADAGAKFVMQYYYKTLPGFYYPSLAPEAQPPAGTLTPYLRSRNPDGSFIGDPVYGDGNSDQVGDGNALGIAYHPVWPDNAPALMMAESLTVPKRGLPAIRGQSSINLLYQQPQVAGGLNASAVALHDPTREKQFNLAKAGTAGALSKLPDSVRTSVYQGATYFPNLPPHLVERFFYDPNRGIHGALVLRGEFKNEIVGDSYLLLNVLGPQDFAALCNLCVVGDPLKAQWDNAILTGLKTSMQKFVENPARPGTYMAGASQTIGPAELARVTDQDVAVDSYALTATGPGTGYVTLVMGDGSAFTASGDPVSLQIIKVVDTLYPGQLKIIAPSNPLSELLTLQQVVDLGGQINDYEFQWLIAAPVQGVPPTVYQNSPRLLVGDGTWSDVKFPLATDLPATIHLTDPSRVSLDVTKSVAPITLIPFAAVGASDVNLSFTLPPGQAQTMRIGTPVAVTDQLGNEWTGAIVGMGVTNYLSAPATNLFVALDSYPTGLPSDLHVQQLYEAWVDGQPQSMIFREFTLNDSANYSLYCLSLDLDPALGAIVYLDGQQVVRANISSSDTAQSVAPGDFAPLSRPYLLNPSQFSGGLHTNGLTKHRLAVVFYSTALPGASLNFNLHLEAYESVDQTALPGSQWLALDPTKYADKVRAIIGAGADVRALADNYLICRYRATNATHASFSRGWSTWTTPQLAEGWIKRVLAGINPFNQRVTDLFNNSVNTDASILTQAGTRWEGDVALNQASMNDYGLIAIYETVLRRGRAISIDSGINYGPANDALLLASSYLNDLYMMLGNEAWADASNPTIGIGTKDPAYGDIATALFSFMGQEPSLLEEELGLLRGRDDFLQPGVQSSPVYNRLYWNYTRGINSGEVIYALNYDIQPLPGKSTIGADAAAHLYPQGHGDAYGHYLTATKQYLGLFISPNFDWVPHSEAVTVLGQPVQVNYQNERKFAAAAAAQARAGSQILSLTWRRDYVPGGDSGWKSLSVTATNTARAIPTVRNWGVDQWASRTMQGAYFNWAIGNALLPAVDPDPTHQGITKVDRTTVPELLELPTTATEVQLTLDNAEGHATPLGLQAGSLAFDINPNQVTGANSQTHFEQIYNRAVAALNNAVVSFNDTKDVTRLMRSEQDSLTDYQTAVLKQELAYTNQLIEIYGTPYPDDVGPGQTYVTGYQGPDFLHFMYVDDPQLPLGIAQPSATTTFNVAFGKAAPSVKTLGGIADIIASLAIPNGDLILLNPTRTVSFTLGPDDFLTKPASWTGRRNSPGQIQEAVMRVKAAHNRLGAALAENRNLKYSLDLLIERLRNRTIAQKAQLQQAKAISNWQLLKAVVQSLFDTTQKQADNAKKTAEKMAKAIADSMPTDLIAGLAAGGDATSAARGAEEGAEAALEAAKTEAEILAEAAKAQKEVAFLARSNLLYQTLVEPLTRKVENAPLIYDTQMALQKLNTQVFDINQRTIDLANAMSAYRALVAKGDRIRAEREVFRQRTAAVVQGYRTRDAGFRIFRDEKLERYKTLFELAAKYTYLAATAYDYETGLLNTDKGKSFINRIINSRALGIVINGQPQYAGSNTGDPGLSSVLAEMKADWDVLRGRLGFNNPTAYGTTVSLRSENLRIVNGAEGDTTWKDALSQARMSDILQDSDVKRYCMQIDPGNGLPVPGLVITFSTSIMDSQNLFGHELAGGDHYFDSSYFATKIFSVGVALEGYVGMDNPSVNGSVVSGSGGTSPSDPATTFLNSQALAATPGIYLIPVGNDAMRSPPLGDSSAVRSWTVNDITIPLPFNVSGSDFSSKPLYQSSDSLTEPLFGLRKHAAFRPVPSASVFSSAIYGGGGQLQQSQFTNTRLIGRSVWNTKWKLVIPGYKLLHDPNDGLDRFINTVKDIKLYYVTYSYAGN